MTVFNNALVADDYLLIVIGSSVYTRKMEFLLQTTQTTDNPTAAGFATRLNLFQQGFAPSYRSAGELVYW